MWQVTKNSLTISQISWLSLTFPGLQNSLTIPGFPGLWEPCKMGRILKVTHQRATSGQSVTYTIAVWILFVLSLYMHRQWGLITGAVRETDGKWHSLWVAWIMATRLSLEFRPIWVVTNSRCLMLPRAPLLDFDARTTLPTHLPASTGCVFPSASSSNFTASRHSTSLMSCAALPTCQADDDYDQQALSSWRYPELGWLLLATEL